MFAGVDPSGYELLLSEPEIVAWLELSAAELRLLAGTTEREEDDEAAGEP